MNAKITRLKSYILIYGISRAICKALGRMKLLIGLRFSSVAGECRGHTSSASVQEIPPHFGE